MDGISINKQDFYNQKGIIFPKFEQEFAWPYQTNFRRVPVDVEIPWTPRYFIKAPGVVRSQNQFSMAALARGPLICIHLPRITCFQYIRIGRK